MNKVRKKDDIARNAVLKVFGGKEKYMRTWLGKIGFCVGKLLHSILVFALAVGVLSGLCPAKPAEAKSVSAFHANAIYCDGRYVYYIGIYSGVPYDGIRRLDTKTGKIKKIFEKEGKYYGIFEDIVVKGKYIYFTWNRKGAAVDEKYVYRIGKNGKNAKKLAAGCDIKLVGNRIYYTKCKVVNDKYDGVCTKPVGEASMKLDGSNKRSEKGIKYNWNSSSPDTAGDYRGNTTAVTGNYYYYFNNNFHDLMRIHLKTGKEKKLYTCDSDEKIDSVFVHKDAVIVRVSYNFDGVIYENIKLIYVSPKGKKKLLRDKLVLAG